MYTIEEFDQVKTKVLKYILYQKRTEQQIRTKFGKTIPEDLLEDAIQYLKEAHYIDDKDYIERAVHNFIVLKNLSIREMKYKLMAKGLNRNDLEDYFYENQEELKEYEEKSAQNLVYKKSGMMDVDELKQYLLKKGYSSDSVRKATEEREKE